MRLLLVNAHWNNRGDEAALCSLIEAIIEISNRISDFEIELTVIFKETNDISEWQYEGRIDYHITRFRPLEDEVKDAISSGRSDNLDIQREIDLIRNSDIIIYAPGGAVISDRFWWEKQLEYIFPIAYAQSLDKKTFFASPSVGPFSEYHGLRDRILEQTDSICLRESIAVDAVIRSIGEKNNLILSCDLAFVGKLNIEKAQHEIETDENLKGFLKKYNRVVGITATDLSWNVSYLNDTELVDRIECALTGFIQWLSDINVGVVLIPQLFGDQDDSEYLTRFEDNNCFLLSCRYDSNFQQYLMTKLYAVVGIRYHCNIFAAKMGVPMIPIVYEQKMEGFLLDSDLKDWSVNVTDISREILIEKFETMIEKYAERKALLAEKKKDWVNRASRTVAKIEELLLSV